VSPALGSQPGTEQRGLPSALLVPGSLGGPIAGWSVKRPLETLEQPDAAGLPGEVDHPKVPPVPALRLGAEPRQG
jgi:hypothetical protein